MKKGNKLINIPLAPFRKGEQKLKAPSRRGWGCSAFTLVELIVTITILAILGTIGFMSFQSYTVYARDSVRLANLKTLESALGIQYVQGSNYVLPDDAVDITASGTVIRKQGVFGKKALRAVKASSDASLDPKTQEYFDYSVGADLQEYQLVAYFEGDEAGLPHPNPLLIGEGTYAETDKLLMKSRGSNLGIVFSGAIAIHKISPQPTSVEIRNPTQEYTIKFSQDDEITSNSGAILFSKVYNHSKRLLQKKDLAKLDDSLVLYFDMETTAMSGSEVVLKDFSKYGNNGKLMGGIKIGTEQGVNGKATYFDGKDDYVKVSMVSDFQDNFTIDINGKILKNNPLYSTFLSMFYSLDDRFYIFCQNQDGYKFFGKSTYGGKEVHNSVNIYSNEKCILGRFIHINISGGDKLGKIRFFSEGGFNSEGSFEKSVNGDLYLGRLGIEYAILNGIIDEVRIYNRVLSEEEIKVVYGSTLKN